MLHLTAALREAIAQRPDAACDRVEEAKAEAASLGEPDDYGVSMFIFGPANVGVWQMNVATELGEHAEVLRVADTVPVDRSPVAQRRANYHAHRGRALAALGGRDDEAVTAFLRAEEQAPLWLRSQAPVRGSVHALLTRTRRGSVPASLRRLADAGQLA